MVCTVVEDDDDDDDGIDDKAAGVLVEVVDEVEVNSARLYKKRYSAVDSIAPVPVIVVWPVMSVGIAIVVVATEKELWHTQKENVELLITFMFVKAFPQLLEQHTAVT